MHIDVVTGHGASASADVAAQILAMETPASFVTVQMNADQPTAPFQDLRDHSFLGATSCQGAMSGAGARLDAAAFVVRDPDGAYGAACLPLQGDPQGAARTATLDALTSAGCPGEKPVLVWLACTPGAEEAILDGVEAIIGPDVPIVGGSAADNDVSGGWFVFDQTHKIQDGVSVAVLFPSGPISFAYQNGYGPIDHVGTVTRAEGRRVDEIDGRPAAEVYAQWTDNAVVLDPQGGDGQAILARSTLWPLGRKIHQVGEIPYYLLAHPAAGDRTTGALHLFADIEEGETLTQMTGSADSLIARAARVARFAQNSADFAASETAGALMIYCGGCMLTVQDRIDDVAAGVDAALAGAPFLGAFTFGEQGPVVGSGNRHGNLMISCIVFGR